MTAHRKARLRIALLLLVAVILQTAIGADLRFGRVAPDFMALLTVCAGLEGGVEGGAWVGFFAGLLSDLFLVGTPLGLSALTLCLVGAAVGALRASVLHEGWALTPVLAFIGTAAAAIGFAFLGSLVGDMQLTASGGSWLMRVALIEGVWSALLSLPVSWLYRRAAAGSAGAERLGAALR